MNIKGLLDGLPISSKTKRLIEEGLVKTLGDQANDINTINDLKKAVFESLAKIPILDKNGILYAASLDELVKSVFGKDYDVSEKISNEIAGQLVVASENIAKSTESLSEFVDNIVDPDLSGLNGMGQPSGFTESEKSLAEKNLLARQDSIAELMGNLLVLGNDQYDQLLKKSRKLKSTQPKVPQSDGETSNSDVLSGVENLGDIILKSQKSDGFMFDEDQKAIAEKNLLDRQDSMIELLGNMLVLGQDQYDELLKQTRIFNNSPTTNNVPQSTTSEKVAAATAAGSTGLLGKAGETLKSITKSSILKNIVKLGAGLTFAYDALEGIASPELQNNSIISRGISSAITGGPEASTAGNALKGAMLGAVIAGPLGAAVGGAIGAAASFIDTKWLADKIDGAFSFVSENIDLKSIKSSIVGFPKKIDDWFSSEWKIIEQAPIWKTIGNGIEVSQNVLKGALDSVTFLKRSSFELGEDIGIFVSSAYDTILEFLSKPFSTEFWINGKDGVFDKIGDIGQRISNSIALKFSEIEILITDYFDPSNWMPEWLVSNADDSAINTPTPNSVGFMGKDVLPPTMNQTMVDIDKADKRIEKKNFDKSIKELSNAYNIATSNVIQNTSNVQIINRQPMGPTASHSRVFEGSFGR